MPAYYPVYLNLTGKKCLVFGGGRGDPARDPGPSSTMAHELGLAVGDDVVHRAWGDGVVLSVSGEGDRAEAVVRFAGRGDKRLLLAWAPLERPEGG